MQPIAKLDNQTSYAEKNPTLIKHQIYRSNNSTENINYSGIQ